MGENCLYAVMYTSGRHLQPCQILKFTMDKETGEWNERLQTQMVSFPSTARLFIKCFLLELEQIMLVTDSEVTFLNSELIQLSKLEISAIDPCMDSFSCFTRDITMSGSGYLTASATANRYPKQFGSQYKGSTSPG